VADNRQDSARFAWQLEPQIQIDLECLSGHRKQIMSQGNGRMKSGLPAGNCGLAKRICIEFSEILENTVRFRILENILEKKEFFF